MYQEKRESLSAGGSVLVDKVKLKSLVSIDVFELRLMKTSYLRETMVLDEENEYLPRSFCSDVSIKIHYKTFYFMNFDTIWWLFKLRAFIWMKSLVFQFHNFRGSVFQDFQHFSFSVLQFFSLIFWLRIERSQFAFYLGNVDNFQDFNLPAPWRDLFQNNKTEGKHWGYNKFETV